MVILVNVLIFLNHLYMMELVNLADLVILVVPVNLTILVIWVYLVDKVNMMDLEILVILVILLNFANLVTLLI